MERIERSVLVTSHTGYQRIHFYVNAMSNNITFKFWMGIGDENMIFTLSAQLASDFSAWGHEVELRPGS